MSRLYINLFIASAIVMSLRISRISAAENYLALSIYDRLTQRLESIGSDTEKLRQQLQNTCQQLNETDFLKIIDDARKKFDEFIQENDDKNRVESPTEKNRRALQHFLKILGEKGFGQANKTLNEHARELILEVRPDLQGTDLAENPAGTIYYYLALDPLGFVENVRIIRGPMGAPMTLKEAYEFYTATDPEKAARILILLETIQKLSIPTSNESELQIILKAIKTNLDLINGE